MNLELIPYGCMATGPNTGFIEVVKNAKTISDVSTDVVILYNAVTMVHHPFILLGLRYFRQQETL